MIERIATVSGRDVPRETWDKLTEYVALLRAENRTQNLVSNATMDQVWDRHILDSAQLTRFAPETATWIDIGSGAGLPGIVIACIVNSAVTLVEPRKRRADFLHRVNESLRLRARIVCSKAERVTGHYDVITGRAVAPLPRFLELSHHLSTGKTVWVLPKGRSAASELADAQATWQGVFHVKQSVTDPNSSIVIGTGVRAKR
jgi:16S rRNA (guanine527-N7)-methyltransferase